MILTLPSKGIPGYLCFGNAIASGALHCLIQTSRYGVPSPETHVVYRNVRMGVANGLQGWHGGFCHRCHPARQGAVANGLAQGVDGAAPVKLLAAGQHHPAGGSGRAEGDNAQ